MGEDYVSYTLLTTFACVFKGVPTISILFSSLVAQFIPPDIFPDLDDVFDLDDLEQEDIDWHKWLFGLNAEKGNIHNTQFSYAIHRFDCCSKFKVHVPVAV